MSAEDPTPGEIWRKLEDVARQLVGIVDRLERRDTYIEENFVRSQVWSEARKADQSMVANLHQDIGGLRTGKASQSELTNVVQDVESLQKERDADRAWRRQMTLTIAVTAISALLSIIGLVLTIVLSLVR